MNCVPGFYTVGATPEAVQACSAIIGQLRKNAARWEEDDTKYGLQTLSFVAMLAQDSALADLVAEFCVEKIRDLAEGDSTLDIICRLIECAGANADRSDAMKALARRLEKVGLLSPPSAVFDLYQLAAPPSIARCNVVERAGTVMRNRALGTQGGLSSQLKPSAIHPSLSCSAAR